MRLATFIANNQEHYGLVLLHPYTDEEWVFDPCLTESRLQLYASRPTSPLVASRPTFLGDGWPATLATFLEMGDAGMSALRQLEDTLRRFLEQADPFILKGAGWPLSQVKLRAPIPRPRLFFGLVQNSPTAWRHVPQRQHLNVYPQGHQRPQGSVIGPGDPVILPPTETIAGGWNPELGVIIGKGGRDIPVTEAMSHIAGLTVVTDITFDYIRKLYFVQPEPRDWLEDAMSSWGDKKSDARAPVGPFLVTMEEIGNPYDLLVYTRQSGLLRDRSHTGAMHIGIERTISWLSSFRTLHPGDVIHMGTMGYDGSIFLSDPAPTAEDYLESEIEKVGVLRSPIVYADSVDDWRAPDDVSRRIHPVPAIRDLISRGETKIDLPSAWTPVDARHFWITFANYRQAESQAGIAPRHYPRFLNAPATALAQNGHRIHLPQRARTLTLGCELAFVIGKCATQVSEEDAAEFILGYTAMAVIHDSSFADLVVEPASEQERHLPQVYARWEDGFNVAGALVSMQDMSGRTCTISVAGIGSTQGSTDEHLFAAPQLLAFISRYITLFPGDVITLGRLADLLTIPADAAIAPGTRGYAEINGLGRVEFVLDDQRDSSKSGLV